jgi:hypothetical protein
MKFIKVGRILAGVMLVFFLTVMPTPARAADEGTTPGEFTVGSAAPTVTSVQLYNGGGTTSDMIPLVECNVKVIVEDANTLNDLKTVTVRIFYDDDSSYTAGEEAGSANTQTMAILTWTESGNSWSIDPSAGTSWELGSCIAPTLSASSGTFEFLFTPGKVATETTGDARWHIYAEAEDDNDATANNTDIGNYMNWYGEITVNAPSSVDWGSLTPGMNFGDASSNWTGISITYIANGAYDEEIAASANWTPGSGSDNATLDVNGNCANTNEFSLSADNTTTLGNEVLVTASPTFVAIDDTGTQTTEGGDLVTTNTLWLMLSDIFLADTYGGSITFKIAQGS